MHIVAMYGHRLKQKYVQTARSFEIIMVFKQKTKNDVCN